MKELGLVILTCSFLSSVELAGKNVNVLERSMRKHKAFYSCAQKIIYEVTIGICSRIFTKNVAGWAVGCSFRPWEGLLPETCLWGERLWQKKSVEFSSVQLVAQSCSTLCDPMNWSTPGLPVHHHLLEFTQTHVHWVHHAIQPSHPLSSPSPPAPNPSQHQSLFQSVNSSHEVAKVLELQL